MTRPPLLRASVASLLALAALAASLSAGAGERQRVPDAGTFTTPSLIQMKWENLPSDGSISTMVEGEALVSLRLDTSAWKGQAGTIRLEIPSMPFGQIEAAWAPRGELLLPGRSVSGEPGGAIYAGLISFDAIADTLTLRLRADGAFLENLERMEFQVFFEPRDP